MFESAPQGRDWCFAHDVGPLDAAPSADRPGDDDVPEVLHSDRGRHVRGRAWLAALGARADVLRRAPRTGRLLRTARKLAANGECSGKSLAGGCSARRGGEPSFAFRIPGYPLGAAFCTRNGGSTMIYWPSFFFLVFAAVACLFAVAVVFSSNIVRMAFYLVLS